jgi:hypothetical protein
MHKTSHADASLPLKNKKQPASADDNQGKQQAQSKAS